jgi:hypothetical protein
VRAPEDRSFMQCHRLELRNDGGGRWSSTATSERDASGPGHAPRVGAQLLFTLFRTVDQVDRCKAAKL